MGYHSIYNRRFVSRQAFVTPLDEEIVFNQLEDSDTTIWSLLLASGYLKSVESKFQMDTGKGIYHFKITNIERRCYHL